MKNGNSLPGKAVNKKKEDKITKILIVCLYITGYICIGIFSFLIGYFAAYI